ncbi:FecR protein [Haloferula helveola]|uniref:FecR protein n=1 Tax=Haloferula helveola TaxID=490095 RepID=A0ABM7R9C2_9BACT|nr:FecR protein [Haloferula helveola]
MNPTRQNAEPGDRGELTELIERWCNRQADEADVARLEELLWQGREIRTFYRRYMNLHAALHSWCEGSLAPSDEDRTRERKVIPWMSWGGWAVAAAVALVFSMLHILGPEPEPVVLIEPAPAGDHEEALGVMVNQSGAEFRGMSDESPFGLVAGDYELAKGIVHFRLTNGVDVVMRGPANFQLVNPLDMRLQRGVVRAIVPESGQGFTIASPEMLFEDLGTEFGLSVGEGESEMYVFTGQVDVRRVGEEGEVSSVFEGESLRQQGTDVKIGRTVPEISFPTPEDVGYEGWVVNQPPLTLPDGLIGYFPFEPDPEKPNVLRNVVAGKEGASRVSDGLIRGARWVSGRWSEKQALLFDRVGDAVQLEVAGEFDEISMSAWIYVDRLDYAVNAIFVSNGWAPGDLHWQILRTQDPILAVHAIDERGALLERPIRFGRWVHVAAVLSKSEGRTRYYVDGQLAQVNKLPAESLITPGLSQLGDWVQEAADPYPLRGFRGKMDEFAIWDRALTEEEVVEMTRRGVPSLLQLADRLKPVTPEARAFFKRSKKMATEAREQDSDR